MPLLNRYQKNREHYLAYSKEWARKNKDIAALIGKANRANSYYPGTGHLYARDIKEIIERENRTCHWCGKKNLQGRDLTLEHLKPINDKRYLVIACYKCNAGKVIRNNGKFKTPEEKRTKALLLGEAWRKKHREEAKAYQKAYRIMNKEKISKQRRQYYLEQHAKINP